MKDKTQLGTIFFTTWNIFVTSSTRMSEHGTLDPSRMKKYHESWVLHQAEGKKVSSDDVVMT